MPYFCHCRFGIFKRFQTDRLAPPGRRAGPEEETRRSGFGGLRFILPLFRAAIELSGPSGDDASRSTGVLEYWSIVKNEFADAVFIINHKILAALNINIISIFDTSITPTLQYSTD